ncbi:hypothetical protein ABZ016_10410 [Streptomyces sp. NPDC006372]|uniref:hypothetical protein n=1 Tax=Streptomyces sp. NPDC006372 TaxID=3155599 RepID=UPI0033B2E0E5
MRKLQKAFAVVTMLGSVGLLGAGTAQADDTTDVNNAKVPPTCTATASGGGGGAGGSATINDNEINQSNIAVVDGQLSTVTQTNEVNFVAAGGDGGAGGDAAAVCN